MNAKAFVDYHTTRGVLIDGPIRDRYTAILRLVQSGAESILRAMIDADTTDLTYRLIQRAMRELRGEF